MPFTGRLREYQKAIDDSTTAINIKPNFGAAYATRATAYHWLKKHDLAASDEKVAEKFGYKRQQRK